MAAAKPIVSTAVPDVVRNFTPIVHVAHSMHDFAEAVGTALSTPNQRLIDEGVACAREASWEAIVAGMRRHMLRSIAPPASASKPSSPVTPAHRTSIHRPIPFPAHNRIPASDRLIQGAERRFAGTGSVE
jgi:hypothetical protein